MDILKELDWITESISDNCKVLIEVSEDVEGEYGDEIKMIVKNIVHELEKIKPSLYY